jgi:hypothetical protein
LRKPKEQLEAESRRAFVEWARSVKGQEWLTEVIRRREELERKRREERGK